MKRPSSSTATTGAYQYTIRASKNSTVSVNEATGHLYVATANEVGGGIEYDVSASAEAFLASHFSTTDTGSPVAGRRRSA